MITGRFSIRCLLLLTCIFAAGLAYYVQLKQRHNALLHITERIKRSGGEIEWIREAEFWENTGETPYSFGPVELSNARSTLFLGDTQLHVTYSRQRIDKAVVDALNESAVSGVRFFECEFTPGDFSLSSEIKYCTIEDCDDKNGNDIEVVLDALKSTKVEYLDVFADQVTVSQIRLLSQLSSLRILQFHSDSEKTVELCIPSTASALGTLPNLEKAHIAVQLADLLKRIATETPPSEPEK